MTPRYIFVVFTLFGALEIFLKKTMKNQMVLLESLFCKFKDINIPSHKGSAPFMTKKNEIYLLR